jgi:hypothetical protein
MKENDKVVKVSSAVWIHKKIQYACTYFNRPWASYTLTFAEVRDIIVFSIGIQRRRSCRLIRR